MGRDGPEEGRFGTNAVSSGEVKGGGAMDGVWRVGKGAALSQAVGTPSTYHCQVRHVAHF